MIDINRDNPDRYRLEAKRYKACAESWKAAAYDLEDCVRLIISSNPYTLSDEEKAAALCALGVFEDARATDELDT